MLWGEWGLVEEDLWDVGFVWVKGVVPRRLESGRALTNSLISINRGSVICYVPCPQEYIQPQTYTLSIRLYEIRRPLRNRVHQTRQVPPHLQRKHARVHNAQIPRLVHHHLLAHHPSFTPRSHGAGADGVILAAETIPHKRLHVLFVELVETLLEGVA